MTLPPNMSPELFRENTEQLSRTHYAMSFAGFSDHS